MYRRVLAALGAAALISIAAAGPAGAHVTPTPREAPAGGFTRHAFRVGHGCDGSPTIAVRIQIPEGAQSVRPELKPGWETEIVTEQLDPPIEGAHGEQITERVSELIWRGGPLPDDHFDEFGVSLRMPEGEPGETIWFPTIQECEQGQIAWIQIPEEGQEEPEEPAPGVTLTAADGGHGATSTDDAEETAAEDDNGTDSEQADGELAANIEADDDSETLAVIALVVGALGLATGAGALVMARRRT
jgi:uncharacterized protein YcnI